MKLFTFLLFLVTPLVLSCQIDEMKSLTIEVKENDKLIPFQHFEYEIYDNLEIHTRKEWINDKWQNISKGVWGVSNALDTVYKEYYRWDINSWKFISSLRYCLGEKSVNGDYFHGEIIKINQNRDTTRKGRVFRQFDADNLDKMSLLHSDILLYSQDLYDSGKSILNKKYYKVACGTDEEYDLIPDDKNRLYIFKTDRMKGTIKYGDNSDVKKSDSRSSSLFRLYPNPIGNYLNLEVLNSQIDKIKIYDQLGRIVFSKEISGNMINRLDLSGIDIGYYTIVLCSKNKTYYEKLIKK